MKYALLALLLSGCGFEVGFHPGDDYTVVLGNIPSCYAEELSDAVQDWTNKTTANVRFVDWHENLDFCGGCIVVGVDTHDSIADVAKDGDAFGIEWSDTSFGPKHISVSYDVPRDVRLRLWRHELGHAFGLHHTGPGTIMAPEMHEASPTVTAVDVQQYEDLRGE